jgi:hypothetical protein
VPSRSGDPARRTRSRWQRLLAVLVAAELIAGATAVALLQPPAATSAHPAVPRGRVAPAEPLPTRTTAVRALLAARADAVRLRNRDAWLSTVDPTAMAFRAAQGRLFDALAAVPLSDWSYELDPAHAEEADPRLDRLHGRGWWAPRVTLHYRLTGYDRTPTAEPQHLTFVPRSGRWYFAADADFASVGRDTTRGLWDGGPVLVVRGRASLVLGHPASLGLMRTLTADMDAAVPRVMAVWGGDWAARVAVLVPSSQAELARIVGTDRDYGQIAAVATAELTGAAGTHPVGDRVVINPATFGRLGPLGRRVVLTHEVTHVATRGATGRAVPTWLVEGLADYVGYRGVTVPYSVSATELQTAVRAGQLPRALPADRDFDGGNPELPQVYEQAWLAVRLLASRYGEEGLLRFYRTVGRTGGPSAAAVEQALHGLFGTDTARFTADWRRDLSARLG